MAEKTKEWTTDAADRLRVLDHYGPALQRCKGDRLIAKGYKCPHCGSYDPRNECGLPKPAN